MAAKDIEIELIVFSQFRDSAVGLGLQNAAMILTEQIAARKLALTKRDPKTQAQKLVHFVNLDEGGDDEQQ